MRERAPSIAPPHRPSYIQPVAAGALAAVVGFASAFAIVLHGLAGVGASPQQAASGLLVLCVGQGLLAIVLSLRSRQPISIAWSTPGAALLAGAGVPHGGFGVAVTSFLFTAALIVVAGVWRPLGRAVATIPLPIACAMLAGVLMELCLAPVQAVAHLPAMALPIICAWTLGRRFARPYAVPVALAATLLIVLLTTPLPSGSLALIWPQPVITYPVLDVLPAAGIAIPMFIVTMASQNIPGLAVLRSNGYDASAGKILVATGAASIVTALFGGHGLNMSAITAALCAGPEAGSDPARRYLASVAAGATYIALGLGAGFAAAFIAASPPLLIQAVAGLALLGSLAAAMATAMSDVSYRLSAMVTFVTTASGISLLGVGPAFWGLAVGCLLYLLEGNFVAVSNSDR